ncbi:MarR family winged helix-turn-helix transcriptional regulator [Rossellomorea vietnamensis]|jgi:DNA-binding MarR family transcriptional regulator|uniref:MarR family winged helix-turn-helix transcriptional regulator n=1 Tax=Rossellomorea vietnamensis TaxID=218284 RepID=UPI001E3FB4FD|nr:MarR family transcriptional regulator [Rossellomorea vietnamensis]MCC5804056.1 MarR family transcriptional regulator [Rossellomorea vietnamensis]
MGNQQITPALQLLRSFSRVNKTMMRFVQKTAADNGLSVPQYTILVTIAPEGELTQKTIGERTFLPKSTLSQAVDGLVQAGFLHRQEVEDNRREMLLSLSHQGETMLKGIHKQEGSIHQLTAGAVEKLSEEEFAGLLRAHERIADFFDEKGKEEDAT